MLRYLVTSLFVAATLFGQAKQVAPSQAATLRPASGPASTAETRLLEIYGKLPLSFEANRGQSDPRVKFLSRGTGYTLFLTRGGAILSFRGTRVPGALHDRSKRQAATRNVGMELIGARPDPVITGADELPGKTNYLRGNDPKKWHTNIVNFAKVRYEQVFDGVDLVYYGTEGHLEYDFVLAPGADPRPIRFAVRGAGRTHIDETSGELVLPLGKGTNELRFRKPAAYQEESESSVTQPAMTNGTSRRLVAADYVVDAQGRVGFRLGPYDHRKKLWIDPTLSYSTYLGGSSDDYGTSIAVDSAGSAYVTGYTNSVAFPVTSGSFQTTCGAGCAGTTTDAFVSKLDPTGAFLVYSTYLGGSGNDLGNGIALDAAGDAYIVGQTSSTDFPTTTGVVQTICGGTCSGGDAFVTELNPTGSALIYSTYLGGSGADQGNGIALDAAGDAYIIGYSESTNFPTTPGAYQTTCNCSQSPDVIVAKLNPGGTALVYATYLGGSAGDEGYAIALDSANNAYVTGYTKSKNFPTTAGAFQTTTGANEAAFVAELNSTGSALVYSTYLGGSTTNTTPCETCGTSIAVDASGSAYVTGLTAEANFPITPGAYQSVFKSSPLGHDGFVTKFDPSGASLLFSTFIGGSKDDGVTSVSLDAAGNIWLKGNTQSPDFPVTPGAYQAVLGGSFDAYVSELDPTGSTLLYSSYIGGSQSEFGGATRALAVDGQSPPNVYVTGYTASTNFPTTAGSFQPSLGGSNDAFVSKFAPSPNVGLSPPTLNLGSQTDGTTGSAQTVTLTNTGNMNLNVSGVSVTGTNSSDFAETNTCSQVAPSATCTISVTFTPTIVGTETASVSVADDAANSQQQVPLSGVGVGAGAMVTLSSSSLSYGVQLVGTSSAGQVVTVSNIGNSTLNVTSIVSSGDFTEVNTCGTSVVAGASCTITLTFTPTGINTRTGSVTLTDSAANSPQVITLTGTATYISLSPATVNFGTQKVGTSSAPQVITVTNTDSVNLVIRSISITGTAKADYTQTNTCGSRIVKGTSCAITVTFTPSVTGSRSAKVAIADLGGASPQTTTLSGIGQ